MKTVCAQVAVSNLILVRSRVEAKWKYANKSSQITWPQPRVSQKVCHLHLHACLSRTAYPQ